MSLKKELATQFKDKKYYTVELFKELDFTWKTCPVCGHGFWTLDPDRPVCGETACVGSYQFIGKILAGGWDFHKTIEKWTTFFERHGHTILTAYPVVSRWRDDMEFTIASIADFQPWVLKKVVPPPANPLVVPQPCIRFGGEFNDLDNIGKTGRHMTSFIMGGQHAFYGAGLEGGYWMDRCIELNWKFLTEELKLAPEEITYVSSFWLGGGNFGPTLEAFARGLEIVNNVFMQYELLNGSQFRQMDMQVIDVGWGIERTAWITQGTPTIYEATFGPVLDWLIAECGVEVDWDFLNRYSPLSGLLNVDEVVNIDNERRKIVKLLNIDFEEFSRRLGPIEALYAIADHTRTLVFTLADGAIPSNVGGGYNLRNILRRAITLTEVYNFEIDLVELLFKHLEYLKKSYPGVENGRSIIKEIFHVEENRYRVTMKKGAQYVRRKFESQPSLTCDELVTLYISQGIPPEMVQEIGSKKGKPIEICGDFWARVAQAVEQKQHIPESMEQPIDRKLELAFEGCPPPQKLYYAAPQGQYQHEFDAQVVKIVDNYVALDQTAFYPEGGGQAYDNGSLNGIQVTAVFTVAGTIVHELKQVPPFKEGDTVHGIIDWNRRIALMRHHAATHIVNSAARNVLGNHVWQVGADKTTERARLDISHYERITPEQMRQIELEANRIVMENRPISVEWLDRNEAERRYGFTIYQGGAVPGKELRICTVEGWDVEACGGLYPVSAGELGYIKIVNTERIQDGVARLTFSAGIKAVEKIQQLEKVLEEAAGYVSVPKMALPRTVKRFFDEWKELKKQIEALRQQMAEQIAPSLLASATMVNNIAVVVNERDLLPEEMIEVAKKVLEKHERVVVVLAAKRDRVTLVGAVSKINIQISEILNELAQIVGGRAGGRGQIAQGGGPDVSRFDEMLVKAKELLVKAVQDAKPNADL